METPNTEMLRGRVDIFVLKAISDSDGYGYDILNYIHDKTEGHYDMKQSSVYSVLKRLEKQGYIYSFTGDGESNGAKRRYYALTDSGKQLLEDQEREWAYTRTLLDNLVTGRPFDLKNDEPPFHPSDLRPMTRRAPKDDFADEQPIPEAPNAPAEPVETEPAPETAEPVEEPIDEEPVSLPVETTETPVQSVETQQEPTAEPEKPVAVPFATGYSDLSDVSFLSDDAARQEALAALYDRTATESEKPVEPVVQQQTEQKPQETTLPPMQTERMSALEANTITTETNYRDFYSGLFTTARQDKPQNEQRYDDIDCTHINDLKMRLEDEGVKLRAYDPTISQKSSIKYLMSNKILRDTSILGYLTLVIFLLVVGLVRGFEVSLTALLTTGGVALLIPAICVIIYLNNPQKRVKDSVSLSKIVISSIVLYLTVFVINVIVNLLVPGSGRSLNSLSTYAAAIVALCIPCSAVVFILLYKSEKYHLINR